MKGGIGIAKNSNSKEQKQEIDFCKEYVLLRDIKAAQKVTGVSNPEGVLNKSRIKKKIKKLEAVYYGNLLQDAKAGLKRLAFYDAGEVAASLESSVRNDMGIKNCQSFYGVSEIKFPKGGGVEVKFFDRYKALEKLLLLSQQETKESSGFIEALLKAEEEKNSDI